MKKVVALVLVAALAAMPSALAAQAAPAGRPFQFGPQVALGDGGWDFGVGARVNSNDVGRLLGVSGLEDHVSFDWHFPGSDVTLWEANLNVTYAVAIASMPKLAPYVGGGLSYVHTSVDVLGVSQSASDTGFNALAGARFTVASKYRMFAEARFAFHDSTHFIMTVGLLM